MMAKPTRRGNGANAETFRQRFRRFHYQEVAGPLEAFSQLWELCCRWLRPEVRQGADCRIVGARAVPDCLTWENPGLGTGECPESGEEAVTLVEDLEREPGRPGCSVTLSMKGQEVHSEKMMTPLKSSQDLLSVLQESVEPQPRGVPKKERARSPDLGPQTFSKERLKDLKNKLPESGDR